VVYVRKLITTLYQQQESDHWSRQRLSPRTLELAGIAGLGAIIAIHTTELSGKIEETTYLGLGYVLLISAAIVSIVLLSVTDRRGWLLAGATAVATIAGFVLTRTMNVKQSQHRS
jgi:hypothetical protein